MFPKRKKLKFSVVRLYNLLNAGIHSLLHSFNKYFLRFCNKQRTETDDMEIYMPTGQDAAVHKDTRARRVYRGHLGLAVWELKLLWGDRISFAGT